LLEHNFGYKNGIGTDIGSPWQVTAVVFKPGKKFFSKSADLGWIRIHVKYGLVKIVYYKNTRSFIRMLWKRKRHAWYWGVIVLFFALRVLFRCARFFLKAAEKQDAWMEKKHARIKYRKR
jgi:hypothetical protein